MAQVFDRFDIYHVARGGTLLIWDLSLPATKLVSPPYSFSVEASLSGVGDWIPVATVADGNSFTIDPQRRVWAKNNRLHYRVSLALPEGATASTQVKQANGNFTQRDARLAAEIVRKELLNLEKFAGTCGYLYKRRHWGTKCSACTDFNTGEVKNSNCQVCYGTGFQGGYFAPVPYFVVQSAKTHRRASVETPRGTTEDQVESMRGVACPWIDSYDVWFNAATDARYVIHSVKELRHRGIPVVFDPIEMRLAPATDPVHNIPRPDMEITR